MQERYEEYLRQKVEAGECPSTFDTWLRTVTKIRPALADQYPHYYKELPSKTSHLDVYRVLDAFEVKRSTVQHAIKKLLVTGERGVKTELEDLIEARNSLDRAIEMIAEEQEDSNEARSSADPVVNVLL